MLDKFKIPIHISFDDRNNFSAFSCPYSGEDAAKSFVETGLDEKSKTTLILDIEIVRGDKNKRMGMRIAGVRDVSEKV